MMNLNLTHHDVNWVYNLHHLTGQGYYLKSRYPEVRLIQCLPTSNKGLKGDFLIFFGKWHDGQPCPTNEGTPGRGLVVNLHNSTCIFILFLIILVSDKSSFYFNNFADRHSTKPLLKLVNRESLDRILRSEVFVNEADGQLRVAHIILGYTPISFAFQAPKCVIKAKDLRLHRISVAHEGFIVPEGILIPKGTPFTQPLFVGTPAVRASSSQPVLLEKEGDKENEEEEQPEGALVLSNSSDRFEAFNQPLSPKNTSAELVDQQQVDVITSDKIGIQRKNQRSLLDLIESQPGRGAPGKSTQPKLPPPPPKSPLPPPPQPSLPSGLDSADPKRKRE